MKLQTEPPHHPDGVAQDGANRRITAATVLALLSVWGCAWVIDLSWPLVLALTMGTLAIGIAAAAICSVPWRQNRNAAERSSAMQAYDGADSAGQATAPLFSAPVHGKRWSLDVFQAIDAKRFAAVCETWFSWAGFDTRLESHRTDEGVDIWLHAAKVPGPVAIVRCKHGLNKPVDLRDMQEFVGVMAPYHSVHGTYTTTSTYTPEALQLAKEKGIDAVDGPGLLRRIQTRTRQRQQALLAVAFSGHH